jgi:uncharacterized membrane protein
VHRDTGRSVAFSDAVFAITITLLVLEIGPPTDYSNLLHDLFALWPFGIVTTMLLPGGIEVLLYEPKHNSPLDL